MRTHNLFSAIWKSFYDKSLYQDVRNNWGFCVVGYLLIVVLLLGILSAFHSHPHITQFKDTFSEKFTQQIPTGQLNQGVMQISAPSPHTIYITEKNNPPESFVVFDMKAKGAPHQNEKAIVVFRNNGYYYAKNTTYDHGKVKDAARTFEFQSYPSKLSLSFSSEKAQQLVNHYLKFLPWILLVLVSIFRFAFKLCQALLYAFIVMIFGGFFKVHFTYDEAYRLALVGATPAFILMSVLGFFLHIPHPWLITFILDLVYLYFAASANRQTAA